MRGDEISALVVSCGCNGETHAMQPKVIQVKVKPNARASRLEQKEDGTWLAQIKSPPVDGKANEELITLIAKHFECRKADVAIKAGGSGRLKLVQIRDARTSKTI